MVEEIFCNKSNSIGLNWIEASYAIENETTIGLFKKDGDADLPKLGDVPRL